MYLDRWNSSVSLQEACGSGKVNWNLSVSSQTLRAFTLIELVAVLIVAAPLRAQPVCVTAPQGLVSWWRGESNSLDLTGANNGVLSEDMAFELGEAGAAFLFNGTNAFVTVPPSSGLNVGQGAGLTLECWINPAEIADAQPLLEWFSVTNGLSGVHFWISEAGSGTGPGCLYVNIPDVFGIDHNFSSAAGIVGTNFWQHVALTYEQATGNTKLFYNGEVVAERTLGIYRPQTSYPLYFGRRPPGTNNEVLFNGAMDEISLYDRALSEDEVKAIYTSGTAGKCVVPFPPVIVMQPTNGNVYLGSNIVFSVTAAGVAPLQYQWRFNGQNLAGQNSRILALNNVQFTNNGFYSVIVSNDFGYTVSSNAELTVKPLPQCVPPPTGLVSWWRGDTAMFDNWGSNNGTSTEGFAIVPGKVGWAFSNPRIFVPDGPSLHLSNAMTIEVWVNPLNVQQGVSAIVSKLDQGPRGGPNSFFLGMTNGTRPFFIVSSDGSATNYTGLVVNQVLSAKAWSFIVATYDGMALRLYVNGALAAQKNYNGGIFPGSAPLVIGDIIAPASGRFNGLIDELSIYNRALTDAEVLSIYNADIAGKCLVAPAITTQPQDQFVPLGEDVKFTVSVLGSRPLRYQWRFKGTNIAKATDSALVLEKLQPERAGGYSVSVSNELGGAISSNAMLTLLPSPTCTEPPAGLISWWPADGNSADAMGTNNSISGTGTNYVTGKVGQAFRFRTINDRVVVPSSSSLNFGSNADFSIEMWVKAALTNATFPNVPLFEKHDSGSFWSGYSLSLNQGRLAFAMGTLPISGTNISTFISPGPDLRDSMFHHVAVTVSRTSPTGGHLYVDGELALTFDPTRRKGSLSSPNPLLIGYPAGFTDSAFAGLIDEPSIYNRALTAEEIRTIRAAGAAGKCKVKPSIIVQPMNQRITFGSNVTFTVLAAGSPLLRYQWFNGEQSIPRATNSAYSFLATSPRTLFVRVTNLFGSVVSSNAILTINNAPQAFYQTVSLNEDTPTPITLLASDPDGDTIGFLIVTPPAHGVVSGSGSNLVYTPNPNFFGLDMVEFKASDGLAESRRAAVTLIVLPVNDPPVAQSQNISLDEDTTTAITLGAFDVDGDSLTFSVGAPAHGILLGTAPNFVYQPATNYFGTDSFTFSVSDGQTNSEIATVSLTIRPVNDAPVANINVLPLVEVPGITNQVIIGAVCGAGSIILDASGSSDVEHDPLTYSWLEGTNIFAEGVIVTNQFAPGIHQLTLELSDGAAMTRETVPVEVVSASDALTALIVFMTESRIEPRVFKKLIHPLELTANAMERCHVEPALNHLSEFQKELAKVTTIDPNLAEQLRAVVQAMLDADTRRGGRGAIQRK